ncbi:MAG: hypothetical protein P4L87_05670 [Formivibrio sp.]|nr:hypothetical protein [Formivibrio sp.]
MKNAAFLPKLVLAATLAWFLVGSLSARADDSSTSNGRYKILSNPSGQYTETYMLDKQTGRLWMMRGQVSDGPYMIACLYQQVDGKLALSPLADEGQPESSSDRFLIKSASGSQYAETYVLDKISGRIWILRGQVSKGPFLLPCVYQLSSLRTAMSPLDGATSSGSERFALTCVSSGNYVDTYVNDIQAGGVWKMRGQVSTAPFLISCVYQLVNGEIAKTPMDIRSELNLLMNTPSQSSQVQEPQGSSDSPSQISPAPLPPSAQKALDEANKKAEEDMKKLFPK